MFGDLIREVVDFRQDLYRNIKGIRRSQALFDDLSSDPEDQAAATAVEMQDAPPSSAPLITRAFDYGTVVTYPFLPQNWQATRFSDGLQYGVWYGCLDLETTVYETVHHWRRFLLDSFAAEDRDIRGERRVVLAFANAILVNLVGRESAWPDLVHRTDYRFTQSVGAYLHAQSQNGLLARSARRACGTSAAILRPQVLSNMRDFCYLSYTTNPTMDAVRVERDAGRPWLTLRPSELA